MPLNLSPPDIAKRSETETCCWHSTFTAKWDDRRNASKLTARTERLQRTSGGVQRNSVERIHGNADWRATRSRRVVTTVTPVTNAPSARRSKAGSMNVWLAGV